MAQFEQQKYYENLADKAAKVTPADWQTLKETIGKIEWEVGTEAPAGAVVKNILKAINEANLKELPIGKQIPTQKAKAMALRIAADLAKYMDVDVVKKGDRFIIDLNREEAIVKLGTAEAKTFAILERGKTETSTPVREKTRDALKGEIKDVLQKARNPYEFYAAIGRARDFNATYKQDFEFLSASELYKAAFENAGITEFKPNDPKFGTVMLKVLKEFADDKEYDVKLINEWLGIESKTKTPRRVNEPEEEKKEPRTRVAPADETRTRVPGAPPAGPAPTPAEVRQTELNREGLNWIGTNNSDLSGRIDAVTMTYIAHLTDGTWPRYPVKILEGNKIKITIPAVPGRRGAINLIRPSTTTPNEIDTEISGYIVQ